MMHVQSSHYVSERYEMGLELSVAEYSNAGKYRTLSDCCLEMVSCGSLWLIQFHRSLGQSGDPDRSLDPSD
jgi:hypothetical protein